MSATRPVPGHDLTRRPLPPRSEDGLQAGQPDPVAVRGDRGRNLLQALVVAVAVGRRPPFHEPCGWNPGAAAGAALANASTSVVAAMANIQRRLIAYPPNSCPK